MLMRIVMTMALWGLLPALAWAQVLTIEECVRRAREHYPAVAQYGLLERTARFNLDNASKVWLPQGTASAQMSWQNDVAALPEALSEMLEHQGMHYPGLGKLQYKVGVDVSQQIWDGGKAAAVRKSIGASEAVERSGLDVQMYDVEGRVQEVYFAILMLDARIERAGRSIGLIDSTLRQLRSMLANGVAMRADCDQVEAQLLTLEQQRIGLTTSRQSYHRILELFIGEPIGGRRLSLPPEEPRLDYAVSHPQLRLFDSRLGSVAARQAGVEAAVRPVIGAFVTGYYGYPGFDMFGNMQSRNMSFNFMAGLKATWNFGSLYTRKNDLMKLRAERESIEAERNTFLFNNSLSESESAGRIASLRELTACDVRIVELRRSVLKSAMSQLRNGVIDATALLSKITDEELAEIDLMLHRIELTQALYQLNHIRNR